MNLQDFKWTRLPESYELLDDKIEVLTKPHTDLWQNTYYHFQNDNAPVFQMETDEKYFSFVVKTDFTESYHRFDQCGIVMYLDSENWLKGSIDMKMKSFSIWEVSSQIMGFLTGQQPKSMLRLSLCGTA